MFAHIDKCLELPGGDMCKVHLPSFTHFTVNNSTVILPCVLCSIDKKLRLHLTEFSIENSQCP